MRALHFMDVLEDCDPSKLSWTKVGVAFTTILNIVTMGSATVQQVVGNLGHTDWHLLVGAGCLHVATKGFHEIKRYTES